MRLAGVLLLASWSLIAIAYLRPPEYDEAYSIFLTAGDPRPVWPSSPFHPQDVRHFYAGRTSLPAIGQNLRAGDIHPPLYFWALNLWRQDFGPGWFTARLLSVLLALATLATLAQAAKLAGAPVIPCLLITLFAYAFAYTSTIARNFALAQFLDTLGLTLTLATLKTGGWRLKTVAGLCFGAASFTNYLAIFTPLATLFWLTTRHASGRKPARLTTDHWPLTTSFLVFLPLDLYFFAAQHASRTGQFAAFRPVPALALIAKDSGAAIFGGLPLYAAPFTTPAAAALLIFFLACLPFTKPAALFTLTALATPAGLFLLGLMFNNTPIEIRYLAFSIPPLALILATLPKKLRNGLILLESLGTIGLAFAPSTMQPQALAAREAAAFSRPGTLTLVPYGNDGVGIAGPFIAAAPGALTIQLIRSAPSLPQLPPRIILATITADDSSRATVDATLNEIITSPCWRRTASTAHTQAFARICTLH